MRIHPKIHPTKRSRLIDLTGRRFGRWTVIDYVGGSKWLCVCDCGARANVAGGNLRAGKSRSCGCVRIEKITKHGMSRTKEYGAWTNAKMRCLNPNHRQFPDYGGRGISFYPEWQSSFTAFFAHAGFSPPGTSLDRIDNNRGYEPGNIRWADAKTQAQNQRPPKKRKLRIKRGDPKILAALKQLNESLARAGART